LYYIKFFSAFQRIFLFSRFFFHEIFYHFIFPLSGRIEWTNPAASIIIILAVTAPDAAGAPGPKLFLFFIFFA